MLLTITTDWVLAFASICQLLITGVGFWLLYTTFILQAKVSMDQQKMLEIETRRVRREIRPVFKLDGNYDSLPIPGYTTFGFYCESNDAYNLLITSHSGSSVSVREDHVQIAYLKQESLLSYSYTFRDSISKDHNLIYQPAFQINIELQFDDVDGFRYKQILSGQHCRLQPGRPMPI